MKYLTIIRHAKSSWAEPGMEDRKRPLNERGKKAIPIIGKFLKKKDIKPGLILCSPAKRAKDTAEGIAEWVNYSKKKIKTDDSIYESTVKNLVNIAARLPGDVNDVFLFGHEPGLSGLIYQLTGDTVVKFSTCAAYRISFDIKKWSEITSENGKCEFFVYPKLLEKG